MAAFFVGSNLYWFCLSPFFITLFMVAFDFTKGFPLTL